MTFLPELSDNIIQKTISCFQVNISNIVNYINHICCYYSRFIDPVKLNLIPENKPISIIAFETNIFYYYDLDICVCSETFFKCLY